MSASARTLTLAFLACSLPLSLAAPPAVAETPAPPRQLAPAALTVATTSLVFGGGLIGFYVLTTLPPPGVLLHPAILLAPPLAFPFSLASGHLVAGDTSRGLGLGALGYPVAAGGTWLGAQLASLIVFGRPADGPETPALYGGLLGGVAAVTGYTWWVAQDANQAPRRVALQRLEEQNHAP
ncbi:MAG: hypothetical protein VKP62_15595 [Candidatus Sericytochromatia bacterium]|nr:hypothetical protein [Candidatus Sericytochromatia bacterium]